MIDVLTYIDAVTVDYVSVDKNEMTLKIGNQIIKYVWKDGWNELCK